MVKHIILWNLKETDNEKKEKIKCDMKESLEALVGKIDGLIDLKIYTNGLDTSTADVMLDSTFVDAQALKFYSTHPLHVEAADTKVRPYTEKRSCLDFEI